MLLKNYHFKQHYTHYIKQCGNNGKKKKTLFSRNHEPDTSQCLLLLGERGVGSEGMKEIVILYIYWYDTDTITSLPESGSAVLQLQEALRRRQ